jgi:hypothetical protein
MEESCCRESTDHAVMPRKFPSSSVLRPAFRAETSVKDSLGVGLFKASSYPQSYPQRSWAVKGRPETRLDANALISRHFLSFRVLGDTP